MSLTAVAEQLPEELRGKYFPSRAALAKFGFIATELKPEVLANPLIEERSLNDTMQHASDIFVAAIYDSLEVSGLVDTITPVRQAGTRLPEAHFNCVITINAWPDVLSISMGAPVCMRVRGVPDNLRERDINVAPRFDREFQILFDGGTFLATAEVSHVPSYERLGQAAREVLKKSLQQDVTWRVVGAVAPTPLHSALYLVALRPADEFVEPLQKVQMQAFGHNDVLVLYPDGMERRAVEDMVYSMALSLLQNFYTCRGHCLEIDDLIKDVRSLNERLTATLTQLFEQSAIRSSLARVPRQIRRILARMHHAMHQLAGLEIVVNRCVTHFNEQMVLTIFPQTFISYLLGHIAAHDELDRESQLNLMNYAAAESTNVSVVQATIWASVVGAAIGALVTLILRK